MNKYNEIMDRITVDPEMKSRVMGAVSSAIKDQAKGSAAITEIPRHVNRSAVKADLKRGPVVQETRPAAEPQPIRKKKSKKVPIAIITSIAAVIVVLLGALLVFYRMNATNAPFIYKHNSAGGDYAAATTVAAHNEEAVEAAGEIDSITGYYSAEETTTAGGNLSADNSATYGDSTNKDSDTMSSGWDINITRGTTDKEDSEGIGDERIDRISKTLPFDLKGSGTGVYTDDIALEVFLGEQGQKVLLLSGPEGRDLVGAYEPHNNKAGETKTTPEGTSVTLYTIEFGNVTDINSGDPSLANAALYIRNGQTYLVIFSDLQSPDTILSVVDVM